MAESRDDPDTLASETALASDDTIQADSSASGASGAPGASGGFGVSGSTTGRVIRQGRTSAPRTKLGRYTIVSLRGRGGMGEVYEAEDPELGRRVAIKVLRDGRGETSTLLREAQALAKLVHPNVMTVHDVGSEDGSVFIVMHLVDGQSIDKWLESRHAAPREVIAAFCQAGRGIAAAHARGLVHCDFKPSNVLVDADGVVRVGDFGLARETGENGQISGTPAYMAPEQFAGEVSPASDQFAFCVALWEVLAGEPPFARTSLQEGLEQAPTRERRAMPRGKRITPRVVRALERGLSPAPGDRFPSMEALLAELSPRRGAPIALASGAALAVGAVVVAFAVSHHAPAPAPAPAPAKPDAPAPPRFDVTRAHPLTTFGDDACAYAPTVESDGTVVFDRTERDAVDLYALPITGGTPRQLTKQATWEWRSTRGLAPGQAIFLVHDPRSHEGASVSAIDLASGRQSVLVDTFAYDVATGGGSVFYIPLSQLQVRRWSGDHDVEVVSGTDLRFRQLAASPAGDRIALTARKGAAMQLCVLDVQTAKLDCFDRPVRDARPAFGADGRSVYYVTIDGIRRHDVVSGADELMFADARAIGGLAVAADGSSLVFSDCGSHSRIVDSIAPDKTVVADPTARSPAAGPHGEIAWTRDLHGVRVLVIRTKDNKEMQLTGPKLGSVDSPTFSPNGELIAFIAGGANPGIHTARVETDTLIEQVTNVASDAFPAWIDDSHLAFVRFDSSNVPSVWVVPADGGEPVRLSKLSRTSQGGRKGELLVASTSRMFWMNAKTGAERPGPEHPVATSDMTASPSGNWVGYTAGQSGQELWRISIDPPGKLEHVMSLPTGQTATSIAITDEGHILFAPESWSGDLYVVPAVPGSKL